MKKTHVLLLALLQGCAVAHVIDSSKFSMRQSEIEQLGQQQNEPEKAIKEYIKYIDNEKKTFNRSFQDYQTELQNQTQEISRNQKVKEVTAEGIPHLYEARLTTLVQAYRGLANAYLSQQDFTNAEKVMIESIALIKSKAFSPTYISKNLAENYLLLKKVYTKQGRTGKSLLADLNNNLLRDYLDSPQGKSDARLTRRALQDSEEMLMQINFLISDTNVRKHEETMALIGTIAKGMYETLNQVNQAVLSSPGGYQSLTTMSNAQLVQGITNIVTKVAQAYVEGSTGKQSGGQQSLNPMSNVTLVQQLLDPNMGVNPQGIIKLFAKSVALVSKNEKVKKAAEEVSTMVDAVDAVRQGGDAQKKMDSVAKFANSFSEFQSQVQEIRADATK